jgi:hypothetical protein
MKEDTRTMKRILWILTAIGTGLVAGAVLLGAEDEGKAAERRPEGLRGGRAELARPGGRGE